MNTRNLVVPAILGLGLYAQANNINLASNTTTLMELFLLLTQQEEIAFTQTQVARLNYATFGAPWPYAGIAPPSTVYGASLPYYGVSSPYAERYIAPTTAYGTPYGGYVAPATTYGVPYSRVTGVCECCV
jgi:hypothetical protein